VGVVEQAHRQEEGLSLPFRSSLAATADAANIDVPGGEEVSAGNAINEEYRKPPHPPGLLAVHWRSG
jgi:hypothetical protein